MVIAWNRTLLGIVRTPGSQPATIHPTRSFALMHVAIHDAVAAIDRADAPHLIEVSAPASASRRAAVAWSAHDSLAGLYPALTAALDQQLASELASIPDGGRKQAGARVGRRIATGVLALRHGDGSDATPPPLAAGTQPGEYRPTPPGFLAPVFTHWSGVTPFALRSASQFRPPAPPALDSSAYTAAYREVKRLGAVDSATRSADQTQVGMFWSAPIQNYWNEIAQTVALQHRTSLAETARLFSLLNLTIADATIAFYDAKYTYHLWRPVTAIRLAATDGNPRTDPDAAWVPLATTPPDPSYPGAHSVVGAAAAAVLSDFFGRTHDHFTVTSEVLPGVSRSFTSFSDAADEAGVSRIYAGIHSGLDHVAGQQLGGRVAHYVSHALRRDDGDFPHH